MQQDPIYHVAPRSELKAGMRAETYVPGGFTTDGFVHCSATREEVLAVCQAYYRSVTEPLLLLRIEPLQLTSRLLFEPSSPAGSEPPGIAPGTLFPHVYGPIDLQAISGVGQLERREDDFAWPRRFESL
jgi:uncharacterized protein (DUF952 family)